MSNTRKPGTRPADEARAVADGLIESAMTGAGLSSSDPLATAERKPFRYSPAYARSVYRSSWAARREIDRPAGDLIAGKLQISGLPEGFDAARILAALADLGSGLAPESRGALPMCSALWAESHKQGGAALVWLLDDGLDPWEPVDLDRIASVEGLELLERDEITPWRERAVGPVTHYIIGTPRTEVTAGSIVHASRVIVGVGARLSPSEEWAQQGWGASSLEQLHYERLALHVSNQEMATSIMRATMDVAYFAELAEMLCGDKAAGLAEIQARLAMMSRSRGQHRMIPMDAGREGVGDEEPGRPSDRFESVGRPVDGLAKLGASVQDFWAAATGQTPSIALGRTAGGLNTGTNAGDWQSWSSLNDGRRAIWLRPRLDRIVEIVCAAKDGPTGGRIPETWELEQDSLWIPPAKEVAETARVWAEADRVYAELAPAYVEAIAAQRLVEAAAGRLRLEPLPVEEPGDLEVGLGEDVAAQALNGAQITALFELALAAGSGTIPVETALWLVQLAAPEASEAEAQAALEAAARAASDEQPTKAEAAAAVSPLGFTTPEAIADARAAWVRTDASPRSIVAAWMDAWGLAA